MLLIVATFSMERLLEASHRSSGRSLQIQLLILNYNGPLFPTNKEYANCINWKLFKARIRSLIKKDTNMILKNMINITCIEFIIQFYKLNNGWQLTSVLKIKGPPGSFFYPQDKINGTILTIYILYVSKIT